MRRRVEKVKMNNKQTIRERETEIKLLKAVLTTGEKFKAALKSAEEYCAARLEYTLETTFEQVESRLAEIKKHMDLEQGENRLGER